MLNDWRSTKLVPIRKERGGGEILGKWVEKEREQKIIIEGVVKTCTGIFGEGDRKEKDEKYVRASKPREFDKEEKKLLSLTGEWGRSIYNGNVEGDKEEKYTFV